jgi:hypothetical protein
MSDHAWPFYDSPGEYQGEIVETSYEDSYPDDEDEGYEIVRYSVYVKCLKEDEDDEDED